MAEAEYKINMHAHVAGLKRLSARANAGPSASSSSPSSSSSRRVSFSFTGYGSNVIEHLRNCRVQIDKGLTNEEFERIEALYQFTFPPDLRGILREGVPLGDGFPNWRSGGSQQLKMWINKPTAGLLADVERGVFWLKQWGPRPADVQKALHIARKQMKKKAPVLVPVYGNCYVAASPARAGNPVFFVQGRDVYCCGLDVSDFFHRDSFASRNLVRSSAYVPEPVYLEEFGRGSSRLSESRYSYEDNSIVEEFLSMYEENDDEQMMMASTSTSPLRKISNCSSGSTETWSRSLDALACRRKSNDSARSVLSPRSSSGSSCDGSLDEFQSISAKSLSISGARRGRRIEFWSDLSEKGRIMNIVNGTTTGSSCYEDESDSEFIEIEDKSSSSDAASSFIKEAMDDMAGKLRRAGWKEEDIEEIVESSCSSSSASKCNSSPMLKSGYQKGLPDRQTVLEGLAFHLDFLSCSLRKAGWSVHDVAETMSLDSAPGVSEKRKSRAKVSPQVEERIGMLAAFVAQC